MRERAKRASASELGTIFMKSPKVKWTAARPVATIVYITLIISDRIECFYLLINRISF